MSNKTVFMKPVSFALLVLIGGLAIFGWLYPDDVSAQSESEVSGPMYFSMKPIVVNISKNGSSNRFLKVTPVLVISHQEFFRAVKSGAPVIRSELIELYSRETVNSLLSDDGFDALREKSLVQVDEALKSQGAAHTVTQVLFNEYVIQ